jgi:hypothetical protein
MPDDDEARVLPTKEYRPAGRFSDARGGYFPDCLPDGLELVLGQQRFGLGAGEHRDVTLTIAAGRPARFAVAVKVSEVAPPGITSEGVVSDIL